MTVSNRKDCYAEITSAIIADLEKGIRPWVKPWNSETATPSRPLRNTGEPYRGINVLWLWRAADLAGYRSPYWLTYNQAREFGAHVRKGEKSSLVVYANLYTKTEDDDDREPKEKRIPFLKASAVFNADQIENLPEQFSPRQPAERDALDFRAEDRARAFFSNTAATLREDKDRAYYSILEDSIYMPPASRFEHADRFYSTIAHELTPRPDHAEYIGNWLQVLRNDKRAIFQAAALAQKATDYLHSLQKPVEAVSRNETERQAA